MSESTNAENVIRALRLARSVYDGGWSPIGWLLEHGSGTRYGGRIMELRDHGYQIDVKRFGVKGRGDFRYRLVREPGEKILEVKKPVETPLGFTV